MGQMKRESTSSSMIGRYYANGHGLKIDHAHSVLSLQGLNFASMANFRLSQSEREYIVNGVREDLRADGRTCTDYRHFTVRTGVVSNTSGSAKIELVSLLVGVALSHVGGRGLLIHLVSTSRRVVVQ